MFLERTKLSKVVKHSARWVIIAVLILSSGNPKGLKAEIDAA